MFRTTEKCRVEIILSEFASYYDTFHFNVVFLSTSTMI